MGGRELNQELTAKTYSDAILVSEKINNVSHTGKKGITDEELQEVKTGEGRVEGSKYERR